MEKIGMWAICLLFTGIISCKETADEQQELSETLDKIESVEKAIDETSEELEKKANDVEEALQELDNI
ncbi:hypothetical protein ACEZ3G_13180 [Maribacter algicola]|uniref:Uncharacterized protein n=1 Tax=Meishania litoralis TaxID=3434685 RepID=A0ACC7LN37_9FLAO